MQYRRREEHVAVSPPSKLRAQHRLEVGPDPYRRTCHDGSSRSPLQQRSLSPQKMDGLRRGVGGNKEGAGFERRDYDWHLDGRRSSRVPSRSPPAEQLRKRSHFDDEVRLRSYSPPLGVRPRYQLSRPMDHNAVDTENLDAKRVYINREKDLIGGRLGAGQGMVDHKLMIREDEVLGSYRLNPEMGITSQYEETGGHLPPLSRGMAIGRLEHERIQYRDPLTSDKIPIIESHKGAEKTLFHARDVSYSTISPSCTKDFASTSQLRDYGSSSLEMPRSDFLCCRGNGIRLPASYELSRSSRKLTEPVGFSGHGQRPFIDTTRDPENGQRNMMCHQQCEFSPTRTEHLDYNSKSLVRTAQDECVYQYDDLPMRMAPHSQVDYEQALMEYENRDLSRPCVTHPDLDRTGKSEDSYGYQRRGVVHDPEYHKSQYLDYHDMRRTSSKQADDYLHPGYNHPDMRCKMPQDFELSYMGASEVDHLSVLRTRSESRRDRNSGIQQERFQSLPFSICNTETYRQAVEVQEMKLDHDHSDRHMKRKYNATEEVDMHDLRAIKSSKLAAPEDFQDLYESQDCIDDEDMNLLYSSGDVGYKPKIHGKYNRDDSELENEEDFPSDDWISSQVYVGSGHRHSSRFRKYFSQNIKRHPKSSSSSWHKSQHISKRNAIHKQPKVWKKYHAYDENMHKAYDETSEDWISATESEPPEGSEEFKQMVHEAFLMYSKKLNLNSSVQRRYKDQGKAGSLYCIVCGRSSSKEFMGTQRLVTHAFMSHKAGLRAKHLGLHKAICVMLGWDTVVAQDTVTWVPQGLPHAEALAQKDDLILWPPIVIIHNISMYDDNPQNWKVVSMETIEAFLRGKGFVRGRIKLCLGKPADQSIILVKFLGTFVGLGDAERLHKYLSDSNRGRAECERAKSESSSSFNIGETDNGDKVENILCGYVGIADDLDKLDFNSKKWTSIKSRKEIEDLDNAPVKTNERR